MQCHAHNTLHYKMDHDILDFQMVNCTVQCGEFFFLDVLWHLIDFWQKIDYVVE